MYIPIFGQRIFSQSSSSIFDLFNVVALFVALYICVGCTFLQLAVQPSARAVL